MQYALLRRKANLLLLFSWNEVYSKEACANKVVPLAEAIMLDNWSKRDQYKSLKTFSSTWLINKTNKVKLWMLCLN